MKTMNSESKYVRIMQVLLIALLAQSSMRTAFGQWQRSPASDVDKERVGGIDGLVPGVVATPDRSCWLAAAANQLAGAGYGTGATIQQRAEDIYLDFLNWRLSLDAADVHGTRDGGWMNHALNWWLGSANNLQAGVNPYTQVNTFGGTGCNAWSAPNMPSDFGNRLRDYQLVSLAVRWPGCNGGHAVTYWGDSAGTGPLTDNPASIIVADSDTDGADMFQTYTWDAYTNPNPDGLNNGNGWYMDGGYGHAYVIQACVLSPTDSPVDPSDGPTQMVVESRKIHQDDLEDATDLHYAAWTDYDILGYRTEIDWSTANDPVIGESNGHQSMHPSYPTTRDTIEVDWDLSDHPVPFGTDVIITTEFILQNWNGISYDDMYFTYADEETTKYLQPPFESPNGTDIRADNEDGIQRLLADDFRCIQTGPITQIFLWGSWLNDSGSGNPPGRLQHFRLSIFSDDPVGNGGNPDEDPKNQYSKPLELLWSELFSERDFEAREFAFVPEERFWDPYLTKPLGYDNRIFEYRFAVPEEKAFRQQGSPRNPKVYWLGVSVELATGQSQWGWKTTDPEHGWNDQAAALMDRDWVSLTHPSGHQLAGYPVDMSFGIVTKTRSGTIWPGYEWNIFTPELHLTNATDITGGYLVGAFDLYVGRERVGESRLVHQYPYTQDPEQHEFTIRGTQGTQCPCADFDDVRLGTYTITDSFVTHGHTVEFREFFWLPSGSTKTGTANVLAASHSGGSGNELNLNNINAEFTFGCLTAGVCPSGLRFLFGEYGGNINLEVNGDFQNFQNFADIDGSVIGGCAVTVVNGFGKDTGTVALQGTITQFRVGGQELFIDDICCLNQDPWVREAIARNFRFGHLYGMPDTQQLWRFGEWMTEMPDLEVLLSDGEPRSIKIDWEGRLPYPETGILPGAQLPSADPDGDGLANFKDEDDDDDGLPDSVETNTGTYVGPADTGTDPFVADTDGDGFSDGAEVELGSDPTDRASVPATSKLELIRSGKDLVLTWVGQGILQKADQVTGPWSNLPDAPNPMVIVPDEERSFYRLRRNL